MGMSASQARLLTLTARLSDLEHSAQCIQNSKIRLADSAEDASEEYNNALNLQKLTVYDADTSSYVDATAYNLTNFNAVSKLDKQRFLADTAGRILVSESTKTAAGLTLDKFLEKFGATSDDKASVLYYTNLYNEIKENGCFSEPNTNLNNSDWLYSQLNNGTLYIKTFDRDGGTKGTGDFVETPWKSGDATLREQDDDSAIAKAQAKYDLEMSKINAKETKLDLQLKQIDTEHNAIQTEMDSVKKVIDKNIERTFKIFDA